MPKSLQSLATGPILEDYDGPDFKVRYIDNETNVQIIWNNGEELGRRVHKCRCSCGKPAPGSGSNSGDGNEFQGEVDEPQGGADGDDAVTPVPILSSTPSPPPTSINSDMELAEPVDSNVALSQDEEDTWGAAIVENESQGWDEEEEGDKDENNDAADEDENSKEFSNDRTEAVSGWDSDVSPALSHRSMQPSSKGIALPDLLLRGTPKVKNAPTKSTPAESASAKPAPTNSNPNRSTVAKPVPVPTKPISTKAIIPSAGLAPPKPSRPSSNLKLRNPSIPSSPLTLIPSVSKRRAQDSPASQPAPKQKKAKISAPRVDMSRSNSRANGLDQGPQKLQAILANRKPVNGPLPAPETAWSVKWDRRPDVRPVSAPKRSRSAVGDPSVVRGAVPPVTARSAEAEMQNSDGSKGHCDKSGDMILVAESMSWICGSW